MTSLISHNSNSFESMALIASTFLWGFLELVISIGLIAAFVHILCFATNLVIRDETSFEASISPDVQRKEQTVALMLTTFLAGIHLVIIFFGLPLFDHDSDSFFMKVVLSSAVLVIGTAGIVFGGVMVWLIVPAFYNCARSLTRRCSTSTPTPSLDGDVEAAVGDANAETKQALLQRLDDDDEKK